MKYLFAITAVFLSLMIAAVPGQAQAQYPNGYYGQPQNWHVVLSPPDQQEFDKYYSKWVDAMRKNDRDDIEGNARHMQEIMARNNVPANVPFDQIASNPASGYAPYPNAYPSGTYPNGAYPYPVYGQQRLSPDDQRNFDKDYAKWVDAQRKNDQDDVVSNARKMQQIMAQYNIPPNVPFAAVATNSYAGPNDAAP